MELDETEFATASQVILDYLDPLNRCRPLQWQLIWAATRRFCLQKLLGVFNKSLTASCTTEQVLFPTTRCSIRVVRAHRHTTYEINKRFVLFFVVHIVSNQYSARSGRRPMTVKFMVQSPKSVERLAPASARQNCR